MEPRIHAWAIYPAGILAAIATLIFVTQNALLIALALVGAGAYLLTRNRPAKPISATDPAQQRRAALEKWRSNLAKLEGKDKSELLSDEQLGTLVSSSAATLEDLHGTLSTEQVARYGNQLLEVLRSSVA